PESGRCRRAPQEGVICSSEHTLRRRDIRGKCGRDVRKVGQIVTAPITLEVLHPTHDEQSSLIGTSTNEASGELTIDYTFGDGEKRSVLLTGDVQLTGVSCLLHRLRNSRDRLRADVLKFPHHGAWPSKYPNLGEFEGVERGTLTHLLEVVDPEIVVLSV